MSEAGVGIESASAAGGAPTLQWQRLSLLGGQLQTNCAALAARDPGLAGRLAAYRPEKGHVLSVQGDRLVLATLDGVTARVRPCLQTVQAAQETLNRVYPKGMCTEPLLVSGVDQGWLWQQLYAMPCDSPGAPGHRPPLYFLVREIEELWVALHLHDWRLMLGDGRVRLIVGADAAAQLWQHVVDNPQIPPPKQAITIGASPWPDGGSMGSVLGSAFVTLGERLQALTAQYPVIFAGSTPETIANKIRRGERLRILGITSRYTTFLQHSMKDWLDAMGRLGHDTRRLIESAPYELPNTLTFAETFVEFRPDIVLMIDHYRGELGWVPQQIPFVMWVQDKLPNIFSEAAGRAQGPLDYCLGFGRLMLSEQFGYPASRYMEATVGVNEARFAPRQLENAERERYACDVSYVSHASTPAEVLIQRQLEKSDCDRNRRLVTDLFDRLRAIYNAGGMVYHRLHLRKLLEQSMAAQRLAVAADSREGILDFFSQQINNALFRHQALHWLADTDVNIHLYGRGWDAHPRFNRYARGEAQHERQLTTIYQASRINLQITPHGAIHQRLFEGLASGGFFLIRHTPGELVELVYKRIWDWCQSRRITTDPQLLAQATPEIHAALDELKQLLGFSPFELGTSFIEVMRLSADCGFTRSASSIWPDYEQVAFNSREELHTHVRRYLTDEPERQRVTEAMRKPVIDRFTYLSVSRRILDFIADDLTNQSTKAVAA